MLSSETGWVDLPHWKQQTRMEDGCPLVHGGIQYGSSTPCPKTIEKHFLGGDPEEEEIHGKCYSVVNTLCL